SSASAYNRSGGPSSRIARCIDPLGSECSRACACAGAASARALTQTCSIQGRRGGSKGARLDTVAAQPSNGGSLGFTAVFFSETYCGRPSRPY
ncbi:hypothetical protein AB4084_37530, partial [Lysobacter sp. 2RAB21]